MSATALHGADGDRRARACRRASRNVARTVAADRLDRRLQLIPIHCAHQNKRGGRLLCRPLVFRRRTYFRLVIAVRSAESLTMPVAPHQFEPNAVAPLPGLIAVTKVGLALVVL